MLAATSLSLSCLCEDNDGSTGVGVGIVVAVDAGVAGRPLVIGMRARRMVVMRVKGRMMALSSGQAEA